MVENKEKYIDNQKQETDEIKQQDLSRRQKIIGFAKITKNTYIPKLNFSISHFASEFSSRAFGNSNEVYENKKKITYPKGTKLTLFPSYTRLSEKGIYYVLVKGCLTYPGMMTRKNRFIFSLARQITRNKYDVNKEQDSTSVRNTKCSEEILSSEESILENNSILSSKNSSSEFKTLLDQSNCLNSSKYPNNDDLLKNRLSFFISRAVPNVDLDIFLGPNKKITTVDLIQKSVKTDSNGFFEVILESVYFPLFIQVKVSNDDKIFNFQDVIFFSNDELGIISDIDDTVKFTGVTGDKRELVKNLLISDFDKWNIPCITDWYKKISSITNSSFHYVSNSPCQSIDLIMSYFKNVGLPVGSIHLKHYTGNLIYSLIEPSTFRKKKNLSQILQDFPHKQFICIGDSGEHDLEAYVDLALNFPNQILAIYIRHVKNSLSDIDDDKIFKEIKKITSIKRKNTHLSIILNLISNGNLKEKSLSSNALRRMESLPPMTPVKSCDLNSNNISKKPPLPFRDKSSNFKLNFKKNLNDFNSYNSSFKEINDYDFLFADKNPDETIVSSNYNNDGFYQYSLNKIFESKDFYELEESDKKGALYIRKIITCLNLLKDLNTIIKFFKDEETIFFKKTLKFMSYFTKKNNH